MSYAPGVQFNANPLYYGLASAGQSIEQGVARQQAQKQAEAERLVQMMQFDRREAQDFYGINARLQEAALERAQREKLAELDRRSQEDIATGRIALQRDNLIAEQQAQAEKERRRKSWVPVDKPGFEGALMNEDTGVIEKPSGNKTDEGKQLTAEMTKRISDLEMIRESLPRLKEAYNKISDKWTVGPLAGRVPLSKLVNTVDPEVQELEAQVTQLVPMLARGAFGEVGVLTDADVARYRNLLPSVTHDKDVAKALFDSLEKKVGTAYDEVIKTNKKAGFNVSGFEGKETASETTEGKTGKIPALSSRDAEALKWANENPSDPRAAKIIQKLGL